MVSVDLLPSDNERAAWMVAGVALGALVAYIIYRFVGVFVFALFVYYATRPIYHRVYRLVGRRGVSAAVSLVAVVLPVLALVGYAIDVGLDQLRASVGTNLGQYQRLLQPYLGGRLPGLSNTGGGTNGLVGSLVAAGKRFASNGGTHTLRTAAVPVLSALKTVGHDLLLLVIMLAVVFFLLRDDDRLTAWVRTHVGEESATAAYFTTVDDDLSTVYFGNVITAVVIGVLAAITYNVLGVFAPAGVAVPAPTLLGLLTGIASLIPILGMKLVYGPMALVLAGEAFVNHPTGIWFPVVFVVVSILVFDSMFEFVLRPYISGRGLHTGLVLFSYLFGTILFGWYGLFLGPLLLVLLIHFARLILPGLLDGGALSPVSATSDPLDADRADESGNSVVGWVRSRVRSGENRD